MTSKRSSSKEYLRQRAEKALAEGLLSETNNFNEIKDYIHELQVYQVELEMQSEELRRSQAELEASRDEYWELFDRAPVGYLSINHTGVIKRTNNTFATMLGQDREVLVHKPLSQFIRTQDHAMFYAVCAKAATSERFRSCELGFHKKQSGLFFGRVDVIPKDGGLLAEPHYRVSVIDVTDKKKAQQETLRLEREVLKAQKEDSLRRLAGGIAHNFNNLMTVVMGNVEFIRDTSPDDETNDECLDQAYGAARKAAGLSTMMLSYLGHPSTTTTILELVEAVNNLLGILRRTVHGQLQFVYEPTNVAVYIDGDPTHLAQVVNNLVANAVEAIGRHPGTVTVRVYQGYFTTKTAPRSLHGEKLEPGTYAVIEVGDTGQGMERGIIEKAVDPFFTTNFTGRGLGLSAVWGIVHAHNGYFFLNSTPQQGTTAQVFLPIRSPDVDEWDESPSVTDIGLPEGKTILYADDDTIVRGIGKLLLEELGFRVIEASGGKEAVELFRLLHHEIACVVLDYAMPDQDGNLTLVELRRHDPAIPALLISGYLKGQTIDTFVDELPNAFLHKPFDRKGLFRALEEMFYDSRQRHGNQSTTEEPPPE